jgi:hypothetical protein
MAFRARDIFDEMDDQIIFAPEDFLDLDEQFAEAEKRIRPDRHGIIQLQMDDLDSYHVFIYPDTVRDFMNPDAVEAYLMSIVKNEEQVRNLMTVASNYHLANLSLHDGRVLSVKGYNRVML